MLPRFQLVKIKTEGLLPYAVIDSHNDNEILVWAPDVKEAKKAADEYNRMVEQDAYLIEHFNKMGL